MILQSDTPDLPQRLSTRAPRLVWIKLISIKAQIFLLRIFFHVTITNQELVGLLLWAQFRNIAEIH